MCLQLSKSILLQSRGEHVERGEWLNLPAAGGLLAARLPSGAGGSGVSPTSVQPLKFRGGGGGFLLESKFTPPHTPFPQLCDASGALGPLALLSLHSRTSKPIRFDVPRRKQAENSHPGQRRPGAPWPRSGRGKAELSSGV